MTTATAVEVKEHPIIFSGPMVRAILEGRKTQTRRVIKDSPLDMVQFIGRDNLPTGEFGWCRYERVISKHLRCPYGWIGDRLWVRETFVLESSVDSNEPPFKDGRPVMQTWRPNGTGYSRPTAQPIKRLNYPAQESRIIVMAGNPAVTGDHQFSCRDGPAASHLK
jgi:hypothetical protein